MALKVVKDFGGKITFDEYDNVMKKVKYFVPLHWAEGWGLPPSLRKANTDKLCIFKACELGYVRQVSGGYETVK